MFCSCFCFSLGKLLRRSLNSSGLGSEVYEYYRMSFQEVIDQPKKKTSTWREFVIVTERELEAVKQFCYLSLA